MSKKLNNHNASRIKLSKGKIVSTLNISTRKQQAKANNCQHQTRHCNNSQLFLQLCAKGLSIPSTHLQATGQFELKLIHQSVAISMSLSVDKFTTTRKASLLEQAKDAISAIKKKQTSISPQESKATKQLPQNQQIRQKENLSIQENKITQDFEGGENRILH